jgi:hypothetical protein
MTVRCHTERIEVLPAIQAAAEHKRTQATAEEAHPCDALLAIISIA